MDKKEKRVRFWRLLLYGFWIITGIIAGGAIIAHHLVNNGNPIDKWVVEKRIGEHLEAMGYEEEEMTVHSHYRVEPEPRKISEQEDVLPARYHQWQTLVVFKNEASHVYHYGVVKNGKRVEQFCEVTMPDKDGHAFPTATGHAMHREIGCIRGVREESRK